MLIDSFTGVVEDHLPYQGFTLQSVQKQSDSDEVAMKIFMVGGGRDNTRNRIKEKVENHFSNTGCRSLRRGIGKSHPQE